MGTGRPHVEITAATLAGGDKNQDRYAYGEGWAFVLDGASSFAPVQREHNGDWYAERLKHALVHELESSTDDVTTNIVARAIEVASSAHDDPRTCPTSTVALARWTAKTVEVYVLGDSTAVLIGSGGEEEITDSRMAAIATDIRAEYHSRLTDGCGFDGRHRALLQELQLQQAAARNRSSGYWIAGAEPEAAKHAVTRAQTRDDLISVVLATDGAAQGLKYGVTTSWAGFTREPPTALLRAIHEVEAADSQARSWPRSKLHDDKTAVAVALRQEHQWRLAQSSPWQLDSP